MTAKNGSGINIEAVGSTRRLNLLRLEPYAGKLARTVLRGRRRSNALLLPDIAHPCILQAADALVNPSHLLE
ncbi:hypothetical protein F6778_18415 [Salmonella enterica]|nr:hypothetical protein [Salmonella enterica]EBU2868215.1 hypothetical protein [Salmonella enterica]ECN9377086.1 hypothetical protein [Salmonella enterica subsp. enterica serovar Corvallis]ECY2307315.1 hypothetical protein [Salmonella enterica]